MSSVGEHSRNKNKRSWDEVQNSFRDSLGSLAIFADSLYRSRVKHLDAIDEFMQATAANQICLMHSTETYDHYSQEFQDKSAGQWDLGLEMPTLTPNIRLALIPYTAFPPRDEHREVAKEMGVGAQEEGPQMVVYILDDFGTEAPADLMADLVFLTSISKAQQKRNYFPAWGVKWSEEFHQSIGKAFSDVKEYVNSLDREKKAGLSPQIARVGTCNREAIKKQAVGFALYKTETIKRPGVVEGGSHRYNLKPEEEVRKGRSYLRLDYRDLPLSDSEPRPAAPWSEFTTNRWNKDHQLFGEYCLKDSSGALNVGYQLDSSYLPAKYGFLHILEIIRANNKGKIIEHIVLSINARNQFDPDSLYPLILAGDFDFLDVKKREQLITLIQDSGVKPDVSRFLSNVLNAKILERMKPKSKNQELDDTITAMDVVKKITGYDGRNN